MIRVTVKYPDNPVPAVMEFSYSRIKDEQKVVDLMNLSFPSYYGYQFFDNQNYDLMDAESALEFVESCDEFSWVAKEFLRLWLEVCYAPQDTVEDFISGIESAMDYDGFKIRGKGWQVFTDDEYVKIEVVQP